MDIDNNKFLEFRKKINSLNESIETYEKNIKNIIEIKKKLMYEKVLHLKSLYQPEQRTQAWYDIRKTMFTASSDVNDILGSKFGGNQAKVILKKCGIAPKFMGNKYTQHGQKYEEIAQQIYESRYNKKVLEFGLIQHPNIKCLGASPDGITTDGIMLEIKCPSGRKIDGEIKKCYWVQMQTQMEVCDLDFCDFFECNIEEYYSFENYKNDIYDYEDVEYLDIIPKTIELDFVKVPDERRTDRGLEKGLIGTYVNEKKEIKYIHPDFNLSTEGQHNFLQNKKKELEKRGITLKIDFWKLILSSMKRVPRDRKWWADNDITNKLYETWEKIEEARINGHEKYLKKKKIIKTNIMDLTNLFGNVQIQQKCMILETDNESESESESKIDQEGTKKIEINQKEVQKPQKLCMFLESDEED